MFRADESDREDLFQRNYMHLLESGLGFETQEDDLIWTFIKDFFSRHTHVPTLQTIRTHFARIKEMEVVDRVETVANFPALTRGDFVRHLEEKAEDRRSRLVLENLKTSAKIVETGLEIRDGKKKTFLKGAVDACRFFNDMSHSIVAPTLGAKLSGDLIADTAGFKEHYERVEADPQYGVGCHSGLEQMDKVLNGARKGELWVHAGFTGSMKSSTALHWAYVQAIYFHNNVFYCSLEMPYIQCRNIIHTMHSYHEKFRAQRIKYGVQVPSKKQDDGTWLHYDRGLDYEKIKNGKLEAHEKKFLYEVVERDLEDREINEYGAIHLECSDPDKTDYTVLDLRTKAEIEYSKNPFDIMFIDHMGLMAPRKWMRSTTENLNEVVRDVKKLALGFNRGMGMAIVGLFQISRDGWRQAEKNDGRYNLTALSYANECAVGATPVLTDKGIFPLEEVEPGMRVWSRSGWKDVFERFDQGERPTWLVETDAGARVEVTGNHRIRVLEKEKVVWKAVQNVQAGDWVLGTRGDYPWPRATPKLPKGGPVPKLTPQLAYLLGAWDGDGVVRWAKIAFTGNRNETAVKAKIEQSFAEVFGGDLLSYNFDSREGSFDNEAKACRNRTAWFHDLAGPRGTAVPQVIQRAPAALVTAYLQGIWDTDGWINSQNHVGLKMKSREYLEQIQMLMTCLGYDTKISRTDTYLKKTQKWYEGWTLRIRGFESRRKFHNEIGFTEPWKAQRLAESVARSPLRKTTDQKYPVPQTYLGLHEEHMPYRLITEGVLTPQHSKRAKKVKDTGYVSRQAAQGMLRYLSEVGVQDSRADLLRDLLHQGVYQVVTCEPTGRTERVYDIEVSGDHEYQTGTLLSHNCERSADIVTTSWIDDELKAQGRFYVQCLKSRDTAPFERFAVRVEFHCRRLLVDYQGITDGNEEDKKKQNEAIGDELDELFAA